MVVTTEFLEDLRWWVQSDRARALRVLKLIDSIVADPFRGIGKPEPLKHRAPNVWSRRVSEADRIVYLVENDRISFLQCRYHYE